MGLEKTIPYEIADFLLESNGRTKIGTMHNVLLKQINRHLDNIKTYDVFIFGHLVTYFGNNAKDDEEERPSSCVCVPAIDEPRIYLLYSPDEKNKYENRIIQIKGWYVPLTLNAFKEDNALLYYNNPALDEIKKITGFFDKKNIERF
jgi:hypothetical protein